MYYDVSEEDYYWTSYEDGYNEESGEYDDPAWVTGAPPRKSIVHCSNGPACKFLAIGCCRFYHPEADEAENGGLGVGTSVLVDEAVAWDDTGEDWQAWEEAPEPQEPKVFRMVPTHTAATASSPAKPPSSPTAPPPAASGGSTGVVAAAPASTASSVARPAVAGTKPTAAKSPPQIKSPPQAATGGGRPGEPRWNVLVNSQATPAKAARDGIGVASVPPLMAPPRRSVSTRSPRRARSPRRSRSSRRSRRHSATIALSPASLRSTPPPAVASQLMDPALRGGSGVIAGSVASLRPVAGAGVGALSSAAEALMERRKTIVRLRESPAFAAAASSSLPAMAAPSPRAFIGQTLEPLEPPPGIF